MDTLPQVTLRAAVAADAPAVARIWHAGWADGHLGNVPDVLVAIRTEESFHVRAADRASGEGEPILVPAHRYEKALA